MSAKTIKGIVKAPKSTKSEVANRIKIVSNLILNGCTRLEILQNVSNLGVCDRTVDFYIGRANKLIHEVNKGDLNFTLAIIKHNYWSLYRTARDKKDIATAVKILESLAKLFGLYKHSS